MLPSLLITRSNHKHWCSSVLVWGKYFKTWMVSVSELLKAVLYGISIVILRIYNFLELNSEIAKIKLQNRSVKNTELSFPN